MGEWDAWIGRGERRVDRIDEGLAARWAATLDREGPANGSVPQGLHWCLCLPDAPTASLGADGHPLREDGPGGFLPPVPLPRRMWAASEVEFLRPLWVGEQVERVSTVAGIREKSGASGRLVFVEVVHELRGAGELAVREVQSIVYREAAPAGTPPVPAAGEGRFDAAGWPASRTVRPSEPLLFRYSALTFNSHRIHYDVPYATQVEGYRGLVVHGPLTATLLLDLARRELGDNGLATFSFRGLSPAICGEPLHLTMRAAGEGLELGAFADDGRRIMAARAAPRIG